MKFKCTFHKISDTMYVVSVEKDHLSICVEKKVRFNDGNGYSYASPTHYDSDMLAFIYNGAGLRAKDAIKSHIELIKEQISTEKLEEGLVHGDVLAEVWDDGSQAVNMYLASVKAGKSGQCYVWGGGFTAKESGYNLGSVGHFENYRIKPNIKVTEYKNSVEVVWE